MEEMIDFDTWIKNYVPPKIEYFAIYNPETFEVTGIYPSYAAENKEHKILIENELAEDIQNGIVKMNCCFVNLEEQNIEILEKHPLRKIDDILHRIIDKKYTSDDQYDILITFQNKKLIFSLDQKIKNRKITWAETECLIFFVTAYNDPHEIIEIISILANDLYKEPKIFDLDIDEKFSIFTRRVFKKYQFESL